MGFRYYRVTAVMLAAILSVLLSGCASDTDDPDVVVLPSCDKVNRDALGSPSNVPGSRLKTAFSSEYDTRQSYATQTCSYQTYDLAHNTLAVLRTSHLTDAGVAAFNAKLSGDDTAVSEVVRITDAHLPPGIKSGFFFAASGSGAFRFPGFMLLSQDGKTDTSVAIKGFSDLRTTEQTRLMQTIAASLFKPN